MKTSREVIEQLKQQAKPEKAAFYPKFFQAYPGGYGEGDQFLGVVVPDQRKIAAGFRSLPPGQLDKLLASKWHEARLTALFILVDQYSRAPDDGTQQQRVDFYVSQLDRVNNWDLVDASAHKILGEHLLKHPKQRKILKTLASSRNLWHQRVSVIATLPLTKSGEFDALLMLATRFLNHPHDLIHKAVGWMLRELGKVELEVLRGFLAEHSSQMPRTMLRYAIEKFPEPERRQWLAAGSRKRT